MSRLEIGRYTFRWGDDYSREECRLCGASMFLLEDKEHGSLCPLHFISVCTVEYYGGVVDIPVAADSATEPVMTRDGWDSDIDDLVDLVGVTRSRAVALCDAGFESIEDVAGSSPQRIYGVDGIG